MPIKNNNYIKKSLIFFVCVLCLAGCYLTKDDMRGSLIHSFDRVSIGMSEPHCRRYAGNPLREERGEGLNVGKSTWYYKEGRITFEDNCVASIVKIRVDEIDKVIGERMSAKEKAKLQREIDALEKEIEIDKKAKKKRELGL